MPTVNLSALNDYSQLFAYMDVAPRHGVYCAANMTKHVNMSTIVTNNGRKRRRIYAPSRQLKWVQDRIRHALLLKLPVEDCVHGFRRERGIVTNAQAHAGVSKPWVMNIDLQDFFPSIDSRRVYGFFTTVFGLNSKTASIMKQLTTYHGHLCQGFSTSPDIANFVSYRMDRRIAGLCRRHGLVYTRYADDLTFSPAASDTVITPQKLLFKIRLIVADEGFRINERKVAVMRAGRRKRVTGLVIGDNGSVNIPRRVRRLLRSAVHHWPQQTPERKASIRGWISYLNSVDPVYAAQLEAGIIDAQIHAETRNWSQNVNNTPFSEDVASVVS